MGSTRKKYDEKGRLSSKVVMDDVGRSTKYVYTYKGDSEEPCRIGKNSNHVSELLFQSDEKGRETFKFDEDISSSYRTFYDIGRADFLKLLEPYGIEISDNLLDMMGDDFYKSVTFMTGAENNLIMVTITPMQDFKPVKYDDNFIEYYVKVIRDPALFKFPDLPAGYELESETDYTEYTFSIYEDHVYSYDKKVYAKDGFVSNFIHHDFDKDTTDNIVGIEIKGRKFDCTFLVHYHPNCSVTVNAAMDYCNDDYPLIPKESNIVTRNYTFDADNKEVSKKTADTFVTVSPDGDIIHRSVFFDSTNEDNCYTLTRTVNPDTGNPIDMVNSVTGEINEFEYNDKGLMTKNVVRYKEKPKKILYKGIKEVNPNPKPITVTQRWHYNEDGKLMLFSSYNDLICNFTAFEYDDEGREIFQASFSSVTL